MGDQLFWGGREVKSDGHLCVSRVLLQTSSKGPLENCGTRDTSTLCRTTVMLMTSVSTGFGCLHCFGSWLSFFARGVMQTFSVPPVPQSACHQPCGTSAASVAKSSSNAGSHREVSCRPGAGRPRRAPLVCHSKAGACLGWPSTSNIHTC